jgi:hypothetical protein
VDLERGAQTHFDLLHTGRFEGSKFSPVLEYAVVLWLTRVFSFRELARIDSPGLGSSSKRAVKERL